MKFCAKCGESKTLADFHKSKASRDGMAYTCKPCAKERTHAYRLAHKEEGVKYRRAYWPAYQKSNKDKIAGYTKKYRLANKDKIVKYQRAYGKAHPEVSAKSVNKRRALKAGNGVFSVSDKELKRIRNSDCTHCGAVGPSHIDHVIPLSRGGAHSLGNLMPLCKSCNSSKGALFYMAFRMRATAQ